MRVLLETEISTTTCRKTFLLTCGFAVAMDMTAYTTIAHRTLRSSSDDAFMRFFHTAVTSCPNVIRYSYIARAANTFQHVYNTEAYEDATHQLRHS